jgi:hypothetical protein
LRAHDAVLDEYSGAEMPALPMGFFWACWDGMAIFILNFHSENSHGKRWVPGVIFGSFQAEIGAYS